MADIPDLDLAARRRILRELLMQTLAVVAVLLALGLVLTPSDTPLWVRAVATGVVLVVGAVLTEVYVRVAAQRYSSMQLPAVVIVTAAVLGSFSGFTISFGVQQVLGYPIEVTWVTVVEALISAPVWLVFIGSIIAARWRYLSMRRALLDELVRVEQARLVEQEALARARASVADSVRPSLVDLRANIDAALTDTASRPRQVAADLRDSASSVIRPLSHHLYEGADRLPTSSRNPLRVVATIMRTQPFRPWLVALLYLATALPGNVSEYGVATASVALAIDMVFIVGILGGANWLMRRAPTAHLWIYLLTLVVIHGIPLLLALPGVADTNPEYSGFGKVIEIAISVLLLLGTSSLPLIDANREMALADLRAELNAERLAEFAEASLLAEAARELGVRLHGEVQSSVLASAAALESAVSADDTARAHAVLSEAAATIDASLSAAPHDVPRDLHSCVREVAEPWREICPVHFTIDSHLVALSGPPVAAITAIVRESIANAFRHGSAKEVHVTITRRDPTMAAVVVRDSGLGPGPKTWGLGLTIIDRVSRGHWTLLREGDQTVLTAAVDLDPQSWVNTPE